jgi:hypothetical protein
MLPFPVIRLSLYKKYLFDAFDLGLGIGLGLGLGLVMGGAIAAPAAAAAGLPVGAEVRRFEFEQGGWAIAGRSQWIGPVEPTGMLRGHFSGVFDAAGQIRRDTLRDFGLEWTGNDYNGAVALSGLSALPADMAFCYGVGCTADGGQQLYFQFQAQPLVFVAGTSGSTPIGTVSPYALGQVSSVVSRSFSNSASPLVVRAVAGGPSVLADSVPSGASKVPEPGLCLALGAIGAWAVARRSVGQSR